MVLILTTSGIHDMVYAEDTVGAASPPQCAPFQLGPACSWPVSDRRPLSRNRLLQHTPPPSFRRNTTFSTCPARTPVWQPRQLSFHSEVTRRGTSPEGNPGRCMPWRPLDSGGRLQ